MKQLGKKTAGFLCILLAPLSLLAQQSVEFQQSAVGQMINGSAIIEFLSSSEFKIAVAVVAIMAVVIWAFYIYSMIYLGGEDVLESSQTAGPLASLPIELFSRGSMGTHHFGSALPRLLPTKKRLKAENDNGRARNPDHIQRGK